MSLLGALFGGDSKSNTSTTSTSTSNFYNDNRSVTDAGGGIVGTGNTVVNTSTDGGAFDVVRSVADGVADVGRMQTLAASDIARAAAGAGAPAFDFAGRSLATSLDYARDAGRDAVALASRAQSDASGFNTYAAGRVFDLAGTTTGQAFRSSADAMGIARESFSTVADLARSVVSQAGQQAASAAATASGAYQSAADSNSGNRTVVLAGLAVVGLAAMFFVFRKG